jgi:hypothetical protein
MDVQCQPSRNHAVTEGAEASLAETCFDKRRHTALAAVSLHIPSIWGNM